MPKFSIERGSTWAVRVGLLVFVVVAPWPFGSVTPRPAAMLSAALVVLCGVFTATRIYYGKLRAPPAVWWLTAACGLALLQLLPMPASLATTVAPAVGNVYQPLADASGGATWHPLSAEPFRTQWGLLQLASLVAAFYLASQLFRHDSERSVLVYTLTFLGVALALFGVYQNARFGNLLYGRYPVPSGSPYGPFVNHNHFAGFVEVCALVSLGSALGTARRNPSVALLLGGAAGLMGISLLLSHSRGGMLAAGIGVVALALLSRRDEARARWWLAGGVTAVGGFLIVFAPTSLSERLSTLGDPGADSSIRFRLDLWRDSAGLFADSPIVGTGFGSYAAVIPAYRTGADETRAEFAESDWVQLACETGLVGLLIAIGFLVSVGRLGLAKLAGERSHRKRGVIMGIMAACAAVIIHGLYDFNLHIPSNALLFAVAAGALASPETSSPSRSSRRGFVIPLVVIVAILISYAVVVIDIGESRRLTREIDPVLTGADEFADAIQQLVRSRRTVPRNPETAYLLGRLYNEEAYRSKDSTRYRAVRLEQAAVAFREAMRLAPARGKYWFELGWTEANRGNDTVADAMFMRSLELEPDLASIRANFASYLASRGRIDEALVQLDEARGLDPGIPPLEAVNVLAPFVDDNPILLRRAAGAGEEADDALERYLTARGRDE